jgi:hypothetical protein
VNYWHDVAGRCTSLGLSLYRRQWDHVYFIRCEAGHLIRFCLIRVDNVIGFTCFSLPAISRISDPDDLKCAPKELGGQAEKRTEAIKHTPG